MILGNVADIFDEWTGGWLDGAAGGAAARAGALALPPPSTPTMCAQARRAGSSLVMGRARSPLGFALLLLAARCVDSLGGPAGSSLPLGTWGGDNAGMIVADTGAHVHIGCTLGDVPGVIALLTGGTFDVTGRYNLYAYPVDRGIYSPARFTGQAGSAALVLTVTVDDTVSHTTKVLGPVKLVLGKDPRMGPCPICRPRVRRAG